jgi:hypothetical protein
VSRDSGCAGTWAARRRGLHLSEKVPRDWAMHRAVVLRTALALAALSPSLPRATSTAVALAAAVVLTAGCSSSVHDWEGVRLGMSAGDVRARFLPGKTGAWTSAQEPEPVLRWAAPEGASGGDGPRRAVFEFHQGMLVAVTLVGGAAAKGPGLETTRASVAARRVGADGPEVRVLSRDCETHKAEVAKLLATGS